MQLGQTKEGIESLEHIIGYVFTDKSVLKQALTHSSYANEMRIHKSANYERLEFLGDAVLELVSSDFLFQQYPEMPEGKLSKLRASLVCEPSLAFEARELGIEKFMLLGKGEEATGGRLRDSILSDIMEALIGAIYKDGGLEQAKSYILKNILSDIEKKQLFYDAKSHLQELAQSIYKKDLEYVVVSEKGPEHEKVFGVEVYLGDKLLGMGTGKNKKSAEQHAAYKALLLLQSK
ncbi:MAG: ribonuclease III [Lachnospiraceae bacterium]